MNEPAFDALMSIVTQQCQNLTEEEERNSSKKAGKCWMHLCLLERLLCMSNFNIEVQNDKLTLGGTFSSKRCCHCGAYLRIHFLFWQVGTTSHFIDFVQVQFLQSLQKLIRFKEFFNNLLILVQTCAAQTSIIGLAETAVLNIMAANLQTQRTINEQLRREVNMPRIQVSEACLLMMKYVSEHENEDCLLSGFSSQKVNPFREKSTCSIL